MGGSWLEQAVSSGHRTVESVRGRSEEAGAAVSVRLEVALHHLLALIALVDSFVQVLSACQLLQVHHAPVLLLYRVLVMSPDDLVIGGSPHNLVEPARALRVQSVLHNVVLWTEDLVVVAQLISSFGGVSAHDPLLLEMRVELLLHLQSVVVRVFVTGSKRVLQHLRVFAWRNRRHHFTLERSLNRLSKGVVVLNGFSPVGICRDLGFSSRCAYLLSRARTSIEFVRLLQGFAIE